MKITDKMRSMIATAFVGAFDHGLGIDECKRRSLCCARDCVTACARIVGKRYANKLQTFFYESLGCGGSPYSEDQEQNEQYYLDKIAALETL